MCVKKIIELDDETMNLLVDEKYFLDMRCDDITIHKLNCNKVQFGNMLISGVDYVSPRELYRFMKHNPHENIFFCSGCFDKDSVNMIKRNNRLQCLKAIKEGRI